MLTASRGFILGKYLPDDLWVSYSIGSCVDAGITVRSTWECQPSCVHVLHINLFFVLMFFIVISCAGKVLRLSLGA